MKVAKLSDDDTQVAFDKVLDGEKLSSSERSKLRRSFERNSNVSKAAIIAIITISTSALGAAGIYIFNNLVD